MMASTFSGEPASRAMASSSASMASVRAGSWTLFSSCLVACRDRTGHWAISRALAWATASSSVSPTAAVAMPVATARALSIHSAVKSSSAARRLPIRACSSWELPNSGTSPRLTKGSRMRSSWPTETTSQWGGRGAPPPPATPGAAATSGLSKAAKTRVQLAKGWSASAVANSLRSVPEEKLPPAPVTSTTATAGFSRASAMASRKAAHCSTLKAFFRSGRFRVSCRTPWSSRRCNTVSLKVEPSPVESFYNVGDGGHIAVHAAAVGGLRLVDKAQGNAKQQPLLCRHAQPLAPEARVEPQGRLGTAAQSVGGEGQHQSLGIHAHIGRLPQAKRLGKKQEGHVGGAEELEVAQEGCAPGGLVFPGDAHGLVQPGGGVDLALAVDALVAAFIGEVHIELSLRQGLGEAAAQALQGLARGNVDLPGLGIAVGRRPGRQGKHLLQGLPRHRPGQRAPHRPASVDHFSQGVRAVALCGGLGHGQRPLKTAGRFSLNAFMPSRASSVAKMGQPSSSERAMASSSARCSWCSRRERVTARTARGPLAQMAAAISRALARASPLGTTRLISPQSSASWAVTWRPVSSTSAARQ